MKIDSTSVKLSVSSDDSQAKTQKPLKEGESASKDFAEELNEKIQKLDEATETADVTAENASVNTIEDEYLLQDFAGLFGKSLPVADQLASDIDLENTLDTLESVINKLDGFGISKGGILGGEGVAMDTEILDLKQKGLSKAELLQQENTFRKLEQGNLALAPKQTKIDDLSGLSDLSDLSELSELNELGKTKDGAKFATDIANLSRAVISENKTQIAPMTKHFAHPEWNKEVGERVIWMHKQAIPSAELRLNPQHLGPITIKIDVTQDQASVAFTAQHAVVKEALEASLPKLREMLSAQQLNLVDVNVSQDDSHQRQSQAFNQMGSGAGERSDKELAEIGNNEPTDKILDIVDEIEAGRAIASNGVLSLFA
ncbi:MAG: hypothetical protein GQ532_17510 [Methylomarinum sp.]|nr:hypothetical protein [Methylomarinum sp.]